METRNVRGSLSTQARQIYEHLADRQWDDGGFLEESAYASKGGASMSQEGIILTKTQVHIWCIEVQDQNEALAIKLANLKVNDGLLRISPFVVLEEGGIYISRSELQDSFTALSAAATAECEARRAVRLRNLSLLFTEIMQIEAEDFLLAPIPGSKELKEEDGIERDCDGFPRYIESLDALGQIAHGAGVIEARLKGKQSEERIAIFAQVIWEEFASQHTFSSSQEAVSAIFQEQFKRGYMQIIGRM